MCQIILRAVDNEGAGTNPWAYTRGDVVDVIADGVHAGTAVMGNGQPWDGRPGDNWWIVDIPGLAESVVADLLNAAFDPVTGAPIARRVQRFDYSKLNTPTKRKLDTDRRITVTESQLRSFLSVR